ncbi:hypothetical protein SAMN05444266_104540 [Chitinophaga jiangningensis]|uniref:Uncharacterized protein n=1 Tax=Chitinophaga jiangningensis TaxID=1419482 RepID=A0A1M7CZH9_9BACT|nr:hypothetical protein SAMN05444266_104540 [Chitinophaga jiangningensis]
MGFYNFGIEFRNCKIPGTRCTLKKETHDWLSVNYRAQSGIVCAMVI